MRILNDINNVVNIMKLKKKLLFIILFLVCFNVKALDISSKNAILINLNTDTIVYEKNKDERVSIASLQKILTSIVSIENIDNLDEKITIDRSKISSIESDVSVIGLKDEEVVTYYDLLQATMLKSAGDAAKYLALSVSDNEEEFAKLVNNKVKEIGLSNTVYKDPIGLEKEGQYSTAYDISKVLEYSLKNKKFKEIFLTSNYKFSDGEFEFSGPNVISSKLDASYIKGGKTGYTSKAGLCLASYIKNGNEEFILVTLNADKDNKNQAFLDQKLIMDYYLDNYKLKKIIRKNDVLTTVKTSFGEEIQLLADEDYYAYVNKDSKIDYKYEGKTKVNLKNKNGDKLGEYHIYVDNNEIYSKELYLNKKISFYIPPKIRIALIILLGVLLILVIFKRRKK